MGESRNGIASDPDRIKLRRSGELRLRHRRRGDRRMRAGRSLVGERAPSRARSRGRRIGCALLDQGAHRLRLHVRRSGASIGNIRRPPSPGLGGRAMYWPRGRVVGGSSSINALVYCRGMPADFDDWRALGNAGWGWDDVRPYFERTERRVAPDGRALTDGALDVKDVTPFLHPMRGAMARRGGRARAAGHRGFQRPAPRGLRLLSGVDPRRPPLVGGGCVPAPRAEPRPT